MKLPRFPIRAAASVVFLSGLSAPAQDADTPIFPKSNRFTKSEIQKITEQFQTLRKSHPVIAKEEIDRQRSTPQPSPVTLPEARTGTLSTEEIATLSRKGSLKVGYLYLCPNCDDWHLSTAGGYAIAPDVIVTCDHVLDKKTKMREAYFVAINDQGEVSAATAVLARSKTMDAVILRMAGAACTPIPLNANVAQGAPAYCFSTPLGQQGYFSTGHVNRFYWNSADHKHDLSDIASLIHLRVDLSTDWAPGSSGSPLFDQAGNAIAHVSTIAGLGSGKGKPALITLHTGIPARGILHLVQQMDQPAEIIRIASLEKPGDSP